MILGFGDFELDGGRQELRRGGSPVELQKKPFEVLAYLVRHSDRTIPRAELFDEVWPDTIVSEAALTSALRDVRRTLGDGWIRTRRGAGVRFVGEVEERPAITRAAAPSSLIGRDEPLARLEAALEEAQEGRPRTVLVAGEAGIGKTRLVQEAARRAEALGFRPLWGRCWDGEGAPPFWPWTAVLRSALGEKPGAAVAEALGRDAKWIAHLLAELGDEVSPPASSRFSAPERFQLFDAVARLLPSLSARAPLAIALDDLHWADGASLELLRFLSANLSDARVLLVGTVRDVELEEGDPRASLLADLARDQAFEEIRLDGLSGSDAALLVARLVAHEPDPDFVEALQARTGGNPLFIGEKLRHLAQSLSEDQRASAWTGTASLDAAGLAEGVRHVIERRLGNLGAGCREVLDAASVVGPEFELDVLERVEPLAEHDVAARVDEAASAHVVEERADRSGLWSFGHALLRDVILDRLGVARRRELHGAVGEALEAVHGRDPDPPLATLAHHFEHAGSSAGFSKAFPYAVKAAWRSAERLAYEDATVQFERALRLQERAGVVDPKIRCELLVELSRQEPNAERAARAAERGHELARALGAPELQAIAAGAWEGAQWILSDEPASTRIARLEEALRVLGDGDLVLRALLLGHLTLVATSGGHPRAEAISAEALETARRCGDVEKVEFTLGTRHYALWRPEHLAERRLLAQESLQLASTPSYRFLVQERMFLDALAEGDLGEAEGAIRGEIESADTREFHVDITRAHEATIAALQGRLAEAEAIAERVSKDAARIRSWSLSDAAMGMICLVRLLQGRMGDLVPNLEQAKARQGALFPRVREALLVLARLDAGSGGDPTEALARLSEPDSGAGPVDQIEPTCLALVAEIARRSSDAEAAGRILDQLGPYLPQHLVNRAGMYSGSSCHWAGVLSAVLGRHDEALGFFDQALEGYGALGARPWIAWTEEARADSLLCRDRPGDRAEAKALQDRALTTARELGLAGVEGRILARRRASASP